MNVCTYCRVSSDEQAQKDLSIPAQRKALRQWAAANGYTIVREFADEGTSAYGPADKRTGFLDMISFCRKNKIRYILVHKLDRFSRNRTESVIFKSLLKKEGVTVKSIVEDYDPDTPEGFLYEGIIEVINQFYSMNLSRETLKGMKEAAARGFHLGGRTPYGFALKKVPHGDRERSILTPGREEEVGIVKRMFRLAVDEGMGARGIANVLNSDKIKAPRSASWSRSTVASILDNPVYIGDLIWRKRHTVDRTLRRVTPEDERIYFEGAHTGLIPRELFERRKALAASRSFHRPRARQGHVKYLLSRLMRCGTCGEGYTGSTGRYKLRSGEERENRLYYCNGYMSKGRAVCEPFPISADWAEGVVIEAIREQLCTKEALTTLEGKVRKQIEMRQKEAGLEPDRVRRKMTEIDRSIDYYYRAIGEGLDLDRCRTHIADLTAKKEALESELELVLSEDYHRRALENAVTGIQKFAQAFESNFQELPLGVRRQVVLHFVERIDILDRSVMRVELRVPDENGTQLLTEEMKSSGDSGESDGSGAGGVLSGGWHISGSHIGRSSQTNHCCPGSMRSRYLTRPAAVRGDTYLLKRPFGPIRTGGPLFLWIRARTNQIQ